jgi:hypothetical protein
LSTLPGRPVAKISVVRFAFILTMMEWYPVNCRQASSLVFRLRLDEDHSLLRTEVEVGGGGPEAEVEVKADRNWKWK